MNLFLTSGGFMNFSTGLVDEALRNALVDHCSCLQEKKACLIYTVQQESDRKWVALYDEELKALHLPYDEVNISEELNGLALPEYDIYYICGGNTFYILDRLRKTRVDEVLKKAVRQGKTYIGVSAGSVIAGPDISVSALGGEEADVNDINLSDLTGFSWVPFYISPHYTERDQKEIEEFFEMKQNPVIALTDEQALVVTEEEIKLIGSEGGIQLGNIMIKK